MEWRFYDDSAQLVKNNIDTMNGRVDQALLEVRQVLAALQAFGLGVDSPSPQNFVLPDISVPSAITPQKPGHPDFGHLDPWHDPEWRDLSADIGLVESDLVNLPGPFAPTTALPTFRDAPDPIDTSGQPTPPTITQPTIPDPPTFIAPDKPTFTPIVLAASPGYEEPAFDGVRPVFDGVAPSDEWDWSDPTYIASVQGAIETRIREMLAGGTGIPALVQQAIWDAGRSREGMAALAAVQEAFDDWAGRGWGMPHGMLVAAVEAANEKNQLADNALSRDILISANKQETDNIHFAVERGIALETMLHEFFELTVKRSFEASKYHLDIEVKLYDSAVALFNAAQSAYATDATILRARIEGRLARLTAWQKELEGQLAIGQLNEQELKQYLGEIDAAKQDIVVFAETMRGVEAVSRTNANILQGFGHEVQSWSGLLGARKTVFDAYESENRGKTAQVGAFEAEGRAFAETVRAAEVEGNLKMKFVDARIAVIRASNEKYLATLQAERERVQTQLASIQANKDGFVADTGRFSVELQGVNQARGIGMQVTELRTRTMLGYWETTLREYDQALTRQISRLQLGLEATKAAGQFTAAIATGALSSIHVQAGISGDGRVSDAYSESHTVSHKGGDRP